MEIMVATVVFTIVSVSLLGLFNYVLKINRRSEALRQASQGMRNFVEFLVKEIRNGQIDYYINNSNNTYESPITGSSPCTTIEAGGNSVGSNAVSTYSAQDNKLGIINTDNVQECFYLGDSSNPPNYIGAGTFVTSKGTLAMQKAGVSTAQNLNPPNLYVQKLMFFVRPICDPYQHCVDYGNSYPQIQPSVTLVIQFLVILPTGEQVPVFYQTSISSSRYDVP